jgi:hypothetical protein
LEANKVRQGLLIYALLEDGLRAWQADYKPKDKSILLTEWLTLRRRARGGGFTKR